MSKTPDKGKLETKKARNATAEAKASGLISSRPQSSVSQSRDMPSSNDHSMLVDHDDYSGAALRRARQAASIEIEAIAAELRIPKNYLHALETEEYDILPGATYGFGYISSYCKFIGIDPQPFLDTYKMRTSRMGDKPQYHFPDEVLEPRMSGSMTAMLVVLILLVGYVSWQALERYDLNPLTRSQEQVASAPASENSADKAVSIVATSVEEDTTSQDTNVVLEQADAPADNEVTTQEAVTEIAEASNEDQPASNTPALSTPASNTNEATKSVADLDEAQNIADTTDAIATADVIDEAADDEAAEDVAANNASEADTVTGSGEARATLRSPEEEIVISANAASWVEVVNASGDIILSKLFKAGETYIAPASEKLYLTTGNAGGLSLLIPGMDEFRAGEVGEIIRDLPLSRESLRSRRSALSQ